MLDQKGVQYLNFDDWKIIDEYEKSSGKSVGKKRLKFNTKEEIFQILNQQK